ncbi:DUF4352 domain-containing protein [Micromonospora sp. C31]|uniref:DUF4352 domain-containing protein n=1 Tax=Micromonospora sp. C31 TaxID=2824876 RepID=UPI001B376FEC|nr:DUF4352 domain-containing protein [Micromonospora sp. C31]MBQ1076245.1 DUF4352 domain-containing protein [Micromonospora sp. C31]
MSHPPPPYGPQDPNQPNPEQQPYPPAPQFPAEQGGHPPQPPTGDPWAAPHQPTSGTPYPPVSGTPGYPPPGYPPPGAPGYPPPGYPPPGAPGYPPGAPYPVAPPKKNKTVLIVVAVVAVLALLCCVGGVVALMVGANRAADDLKRALPTPGITDPAPDGPSPSAKDGETFNLRPGATLVVSDDEGTMEITVTRFTTETKGCRTYAPAPDKGMYLIAHVTATVTKGKSSINPFYFKWVAANGTTANGLAGVLSGCGDTLDSGNNLRAGSKRAGTVVFDVADKNGTLEYQHRFETAGSWRP